ncbi:MAG: VCBS repeat-containing protein [Planctomycetota bacterium]
MSTVRSLSLTLAALASLLSGSASAQEEPNRTFFGSRLFRGSHHAIGDFDGDGRLDLAHWQLNSMVAQLSRGRGRFEAVQGPALDILYPESLVAGDLDEDGRPDLIAHTNSGILLLRGLGSGHFDSGNLLSSFSIQPLVADLNGDGHLDIAWASSREDERFQRRGSMSRIRLPGSSEESSQETKRTWLTIGIGSGRGTIKDWTRRAFEGPGYSADWQLAAANLDNDGRQDLIAHRNGQLLLLRQLAPLRFEPEPLSVEESMRAVVAGELDGEAGFDIAFVHSIAGVGWQLSVLWNDGKGSFPARSDIPLEGGGTLRSVTIADLDASGLAEILLPCSDGSIEVVTILEDRELSRPKRFASRYYGLDVSVADLDADGRVDIIQSDNYPGPFVQYSSSSSPLPSEFVFETSSYVFDSPRTSLLSDFDGDGRVDLLIADAVTEELRFHGDVPGGGLTEAPRVSFTMSSGTVAEGDFDGDGRLDIVIAQERDGDSGVGILLGSGDGTFEPAGHLTYPEGFDPSDLRSAHLDGDAASDVVSLALKQTWVPPFDFEEEWELRIHLGDGAGGFLGSSVVPSERDALRQVEAVDFDGDGHADLATILFEPDVLRLWRNDGQARFDVLAEIPLDVQPRRFACADVDTDGDTDLIVSTAYRTRVYRNDGSAHFIQSADIDLIGGQSIAVGHFDEDAHLDIAIAATQELAVLLGDGTGQFRHAAAEAYSLHWIRALELGNDGRADLLGSVYADIRGLTLLRNR